MDKSLESNGGSPSYRALFLDTHPVLPRLREFRPWRPKIPLPYPRKQTRITGLDICRHSWDF